MTLEELIYKWFTENKDLTEVLASFAEKTAVFYQSAPADNQKGWGSGGQYPRIVYAIDMQADQERKSAGTMEISLLCDEAGTPPEKIEPIVKKCLKDLLILPDGEFPYCFAWARTDSFEIPSRETGSDVRVIGMEIRFDILEYNFQETTDPDPIIATMQYLKEIYPKSLVIGYDHLDKITEATTERPIIYCKLTDIELAGETNTVAWMDGKIALHILCPDSAYRMKIVTAIANKLSLEGEVTLLDQSPMFIKNLRVNYRADYLKDGQISMTGHYGLLRYCERMHTIKEVNIR